MLALGCGVLRLWGAVPFLSSNTWLSAGTVSCTPPGACVSRVGAPSDGVQLTEEETEYKILCVKHVLESHVVFQFLCTNTVREQVLEDVSVTMDLSEAVRAAVCREVLCWETLGWAEA